jgi:hypothetical protein
MRVILTTQDATGQEEKTFFKNQTAEQVTELLKHPFFKELKIEQEKKPVVGWFNFYIMNGKIEVGKAEGYKTEEESNHTISKPFCKVRVSDEMPILAKFIF